MSDSPRQFVTPNAVAVGLTDFSCLAGVTQLLFNGFLAAGVWTTANTAYYIPFQVEIPFIVKTIGIRVSVQSGNCDVGIYSEQGKAVVTKGSTAVAAAGTQTFDMTASISQGAASPPIGPGTYYFGMNCDNITASFFRCSSSNAGLARVCGVQQQAVGAVALPATATFANPATAYFPGFLVSGGTVI